MAKKGRRGRTPVDAGASSGEEEAGSFPDKGATKRRRGADNGGGNGRKSEAGSPLLNGEPPAPVASTSKADDDDGYDVPLDSIDACIRCALCKGFLIDATTVQDCLHSFCKSCLLLYFEDENNTCPKCGILIHQSNPATYVCADPSLQEVVYRLLPTVMKKEIDQRQAFVDSRRAKNGEKKGAPEKKEPNEEEEDQEDQEDDTATNRCPVDAEPEDGHHRRDNQLAVELQPGDARMEGEPRPARTILRLSDFATVNTLKRYLALAMWGTPARYSEMDLFCNGELMGKDYSMKFIQVTRCRHKPKDRPLLLHYKYHIDF